MNSAQFAFSFAYQQAKAGRVVRLHKSAGRWCVTVRPAFQLTVLNSTRKDVAA